MVFSRKFQTILAIVLISFAIIYLVPSVFGFKDIREAAEAKGEKPPWYVRLFPADEINLGLDLRGGIYLELEVDLNDALIHRSALVASALSRNFKEKNLAFKSIEALPKTAIVAVLLNDPSQTDAAEKIIRDAYGSNLNELSSAPLLLFKMNGSPDAQLAKFQEILHWGQTQPEILDISKKNDILQVVLKSGDKAADVKQAIQGQFSDALSPEDIKAGIFLAQSESYQKNLKDETLKQAVETIRNRIDRYGVAEPTIRLAGDNRVVVELPGVKDPDRAIGLVKRAGKLEFKIVDDSISDSDKNPELQTLIATARSENSIPEGYTEEIVGQLNEALKGKIPAEDEVAYELIYDSNKKISGGRPYLLKKRVDVSGEMLSNAQVSVDQNEPFVSLSFNETGIKAFGELTSANVHKRLAIVLDGNVSKAPVLESAILGGQARITLGGGDYQGLLSEAEDLVVVLREGALPASLKEATKTVIGPSLGKTSIERSFSALLIAAAVVMIFMALWYRWSGVLADIAVALNILMIFAALAMFGATLTLPGIAGIVLTIGMAVDANVIILERIKDELNGGRSVKAAIEVGYSNAIRAVVDGHVTIFISGVILYYLGTGPVRGFAVTLMIGIITTLYTAVALTKLVYGYILSKRTVLKLSL